MSEPVVSVVMASYNHERFVGEAVESVLAQTLQDFEFIVTDDGSADRTADIVASYDDKRIHLKRFERNRGACIALNEGVRTARGRYIAVINSDDAFVAEKLDIQARYLDAHPEVAAVFSWVQVIDDDGAPFADPTHQYYSVFEQANRTRYEWLCRFFTQGNCLCHPTLMIRRQAYGQVGCYDERLQQLPDLDMWVRLCLRHEIQVLSDRLIRFRVRADQGNASGSTPDAAARALWEYRRILDHYLRLSAQEVTRVFPQCDTGDGIEDRDVPYLLARIALDTRTGVRELFGLETLYGLLGTADAARLEQRFGFTATDLLRLARGADPFNAARLKQLAARVAELQPEIGRRGQGRHEVATPRSRSLLRKVLADAFRFRH